MQASAAGRTRHHTATRYTVVRADLPAGTIGVADGIVVIAATDDEIADRREARSCLESLGLLACGCCGLEKETKGA